MKLEINMDNMDNLKEKVKKMQKIIDDIFILLSRKSNYLGKCKCNNSETFDILCVHNDYSESIRICYKCGGQRDF
ncbi:MAG: hypothetical protein ACTSPD_09670 [Promethearchaeota archaeon]